MAKLWFTRVLLQEHFKTPKIDWTVILEKIVSHVSFIWRSLKPLIFDEKMFKRRPLIPPWTCHRGGSNTYHSSRNKLLTLRCDIFESKQEKVVYISMYLYDVDIYLTLRWKVCFLSHTHSYPRPWLLNRMRSGLYACAVIKI